MDDRPISDEPDPSLVWRWAARAVSPALGWLLAIGGIVAILLGWAGASRQEFPAQQTPFLISGGLLGVALVFFGGVFLALQDVRRLAERMTRLERQVGELHGVLLQRPEAAEAIVATADPVLTDDVVVLAGGETFHRSDCAVVAGKEDTTSLPVEAAADRGLSPCKLCTPVLTLGGASAR